MEFTRQTTSNGKGRALLICALAMFAGLALVEGQTVDINSATPVSSGLSGIRSMFQFDPVVDTGVSDLGGRRVYVHVPGVFDLKLDTRADRNGLRMTQSVLSGLVNIYMDRTRDPVSQRLQGPISVKVGGLTVYQNQDARQMSVAPPAPMV